METIIFLIIAGILSSIFGKAKGKSTPGRTKPFTVKGLNERSPQVEPQMTTKSRKSGQVSIGQPAHQNTNFHSPEEKYLEIKQQPVVSNKQLEQQKKTTLFKADSQDVSLENPDEKTIINGIIWAEILSEPRAKKPYFPRKC